MQEFAPIGRLRLPVAALGIVAKSDYRARCYDPNVGRFAGEDSSGFAGGINFYSYTYNDPIDFRDPAGLYALEGFTAAQQVDMMNAIAAVRKKLEGCPSCVTDPNLRKKLLGFIAGGNNGSGIKFKYEANLKVGCGGTTWFWGITYIHDWTKGACSCLPATIIHELVHHTWQNIIIPPGTKLAEKKPEAIEDACYPHPFGDGCKF